MPIDGDAEVQIARVRPTSETHLAPVFVNSGLGWSNLAEHFARAGSRYGRSSRGRLGGDP